MSTLFPTRRRSMLVSWLSVLVLLTSVLGWLPAAAQDATPPALPTATAEPTSAPDTGPNTLTSQDNPVSSLQDESSTTLQDDDSGDGTPTDQQLVENEPLDITAVSLECGLGGATVTGSITIANPRNNGSVELQLVAGETVLSSRSMPLNASQDSIRFDFVLEPSAASAGSSVVVTAREEEADAAPVTSNAVAISRTDSGTTVCGAVAQPTSTATVAVTATATVTPTGTVVATATVSPTASPTPDDEVVQQLVAELVRILEEVLNAPTPTEPPDQDQGGDSPTPTPEPDDPPDGPTGERFGTVVNTNGYSLRCRTEPVDGPTIMLIPLGTRVELRGETSNGWVPVLCNGEKGWVSATYFQIEGDESPDPPADGDGETRTAMVTGTGGAGLRCRTAPVNGDVILVMREGAEVKTRGAAQDGWVPVTCGGQNGWASAAYLIFGGGGGSGELWIDIDLGSQYMRIYRGDTVIRGTYVSTGRPGFDTPTGTYYILVKYPSDDMEGVLGGEYYNVPNVPWTMYFTNRGHAIHGAYWHNNFGQVMSHGCVNAPVPFAEWLYSITPLGTRVRIHY